MRSTSYLRPVAVRALLAGAAWLAATAAPAEGNTATVVGQLPPTVLRVEARADTYSVFVSIEFAQPMIPLGGGHDPDNPPPIRIEPELGCLWGWYGQLRLECEQSGEKLPPPATRYTAYVHEGLFTQDGQPIPPFQFEFETARPQVESAFVIDWLGPSQPVIALWTNMPVPAESLAAHLDLVGPTGRIGDLLVRATERGFTHEYTVHAEPGTAWLVAPDKPLQPDTYYSIALDAGLKIGRDTLPGVAQKMLGWFRTWGEFRFIDTLCTSLRLTYSQPVELEKLKRKDLEGTVACDPRDPVPFVFSAPVDRDWLAKVFKNTPLADAVAAKQTVSPHGLATLSIEGAPAGGTFTFRLSEDIRDRFGRPLTGSREVRFETENFPPAARPVQPVAVIAEGSSIDFALHAVNTERYFFDARIETSAAVEPLREWRNIVTARTNEPHLVPLGISDMLGGESGRVIGWAGLRERESMRMIGRYDLAQRTRHPEYRHDPEREGLTFEAIVTPFNIVVPDTHDPIVWVTDIHTGAPVPNVRVVRGYSPFETDSYGRRVRCPSVQRTTDNVGVARFSRDELAWRDGCDREQVSVRHRDSLAILPLEFSFRSEAGDGEHHRAELNEEELIVWGFTHKALYRPGETVHYKLYVRERFDNRLEVPAELSGFRLEDTGYPGSLVFDDPAITLTEFGTHAGNIRLPENVADGSHRISVGREHYDDRYYDPPRGGVDFLVATFEPQPYAVLAGTDLALVLPGEVVTVTATAEYTAGGPYGGAAGQILAVIEPDSFRVDTDALGQFDFEGTHAYWPDENPRRSTTGLRFSADGKLAATPVLPDTEIEYGKLKLSVAARHENGAWVYSPELSLPYAKRTHFIGIHGPPRDLPAGRPFDAKVATVSALGELQGGFDVEVELERLTESHAAARFRSEKDGGYRSVATCTFTSSGGIDTCSFPALEPGEHRLTARLSDDEGLLHQLVRQFTVPGRVAQETAEPTRLELEAGLIPEQKKYEVGEVAELELTNPFGNAQALVLIRRNRLIDYWTQPLDEPIETLRLPLEETHAPGITVQVMIVPADLQRWTAKNSEVDIPTWSVDVHTDIEVASRAPPLAVRVQSDRSEFSPGDKVTLELTATEPGRHEFAIAVVDEALLTLIEEGQSYFDPDRPKFLRLIEHWERPGSWILSRQLLSGHHEKFSYPDRAGRQFLLKHRAAAPGMEQGLITVTGSRISSYDFSDLPEQDGFVIDELSGRSAREGGTLGAMVADSGIRLRTLFAESAYWEPAIPSDAAGRAVVYFKLPDNLTRWRAVAVVTNSDGRVATGSHTLPVTLPVEVRTELPAQLTEGDHFTARANVVNRESQPRQVTFTIAADSAASAGGPPSSASRSLLAKPFLPQSIALPVDANPGAVDVLALARASDTGDAILRSVSVRGTVERRTLPLVGAVVGGHAIVPIESPGDAATARGRLEIGLSSSVIGDLTDTFGYMRDFEHACWEQNLSRALAAAHRKRLAPFVAPDVHYPAGFVQSMLRTARQFAAPGGGMTFFQAEDHLVSDYLTTYTVQAFNWLLDAGFTVPDALHSSLRQYLLRRLERDREQRAKKTDRNWWPLSADERASMLAGLADTGMITPQLVASLLDDRMKLSVFGRSQLLIALEGNAAFTGLQRTLADELRAHTKESTTKVEITEGDRPDPELLSSSAKTHCAMILALGRLDAPAIDTDWLAKLVRTAQQTRVRQAGFGNTHANAICLQALAEYHERHEIAPQAVTVRPWLNGKRFEGIVLKQDADLLTAVEAPLDLEKPEHRLELRANTDEPVFYGLRLKYDVDLATRPAENAGFTITRSYSVYRDDEWQPMDASAPARIGEWVRIRLHVVNPAVRHYIAVSDPVPGGLRPTDPTLSTVAPAGLLDQYAGSYYFYERQLKPDTSRFYADFLAPGAHQIVYFAQATTSGEFIALPARVEDMYAEDIYGTTDPQRIEIAAGD